jgi:hypothetical protein
MANQHTNTACVPDQHNADSSQDGIKTVTRTRTDPVPVSHESPARPNVSKPEGAIAHDTFTADPASVADHAILQPRKARKTQMTSTQPFSRKLTTRRFKITAAVVGAAAAVALLAGPALAAEQSPAAPASTAATSPTVHINYMYSEVAPANGVDTWQWLGGSTFGHPSEEFANTSSRAVVTGTATFGSSNGAEVSGMLGVCYQPAAGGTIMFGNWESLDFTAPAGQWVTQTISGTILPGANGFAAGKYAVGLCVSQTSANLVYDAISPALQGSVIVANNATS